MGKWINDPYSKPRELKAGRRHPLLLHQQFNEQLFWPAILIFAICAGLLVWNPVEFQPYRLQLGIMLVATGFILVLTLAFRLAAYVQCRLDGLLVQTPFQRVKIPYAQIRLTRPTQLYHLFPPDKQRWTQRSFLAPLWGKTVVVIEMDKLPHRAGWLRTWMGKYMVCSDVTGLALLVRDWMGLRSELDEFIAVQRRPRAKP
ncbi:MAG: hypothetical protein JXM73_08655 [Anaerolineae bacterium]|nr:hypothetical protein [Anaerolineae bacterium]